MLAEEKSAENSIILNEAFLMARLQITSKLQTLYKICILIVACCPEWYFGHNKKKSCQEKENEISEFLWRRINYSKLGID